MPDDSFDSTIKTVTRIPAGYVTAKDFAKKCEVSSAAITLAKKRGQFSAMNLRWVKFDKVKPRLFYHWDAEGPEYIRSLPQARWPQWFQEQESQEVVEDSATVAGGEPDGTTGSTSYGVGTVKTLQGAKLKMEQLKVEKAELELRQAKNELLSVEEIGGFLQGAAANIRSTLMTLPNKLATQLAPLTDEHECLTLIQREFKKVLEKMEDFDALTADPQNMEAIASGEHKD